MVAALSLLLAPGVIMMTISRAVGGDEAGIVTALAEDKCIVG